MIEREFRDWLASADTVTLACWDLGHIWDASLYDDIEQAPHGAFLLTGYCQREIDGENCGVRRARYLTSTWSPDPSHNVYTYPRDYSPRGQMREGFFMDAAHRATIRKELARRATEKRAERKRAGNQSTNTEVPIPHYSGGE
jgi:hypothetical protein